LSFRAESLDVHRADIVLESKNLERQSMERNRVLVVDDEKNQREIYTLILEDDGYQVTAAQSGEQALRFAREKPFDLVLTDYKMTGM
jgi:CheY-like chemotaxis protein